MKRGLGEARGHDFRRCEIGLLLTDLILAHKDHLMKAVNAPLKAVSNVETIYRS